MAQAKGTFEVKLKFETYDEGPGMALARAGGDKVFEGELEGTSHVEMLSARDEKAGAYVAIERIRGTLAGKAGTFVVHHLGLAGATGQTLEIRVVAGSGTGELAGLRGSMTIDIVEKKHFYTLDYEL